MRSTIALVVVALSMGAMAREIHSVPGTVDATVDRGLGFLVKDALAWRTAHGCVSCHHAALVVWSMREAKQLGYPVNDAVLSDLTKWVADSGNGRTQVGLAPGAANAANATAVWYILALAADPHADSISQNGLKLLAQTVASGQTANGSWSSWPNSRPPIFGNSDESATSLASLALMSTTAGADSAARSAGDKGVKWLTATAPDNDPQSTAVRLVLWAKLGRPAKELKALVRRIEQRQNADGGWSQAADMDSDAWATGEALYALAYARVTRGDPAIKRGQAFLTRTQAGDGSWPMTSRPIKPGDPGSKSLIPIISAGSAWAVLGLVRSGGPGPLIWCN